MARRAAGGFGRMQTGNLHLYAFLVLAGLVGALAWTLAPWLSRRC